ncbi:MAG TPA: hybrid sensor histidine kinase/response regulator, partial [Polyangiaceae bacterium]|nr:hybrid sensor histidine kinase/response regulator [Polyangiaceae bacterium]
ISNDTQDAPLREALQQVMNGLHEAEEGAGRVANTVKELRAFGRVEERSKRLVDPRACVEWALRLTGNQLLHQAHLVTDLREVPNVKANELKLSQVIVNLLTNAAQALVGGREDNEVRVATWTDETGGAVLEVLDNGRGMSEAVRQAIFQPFFTTKSVGNGTGLGLSICQSIVESFGGEIAVESAEGKGSCFRVRLPAGIAESGPPEPGPVSTPPAPSEGFAHDGAPPKVLVIDDEPMIRKLVGRLLGGHYRVTSVESVRAALAELNHSTDYDAILCDLMMPGESGMDLFGVLRRLYPDLLERTAFITGGAVTPDTRKFLETASRPVLNKPFNAQTLNGFVQQLIGVRAIQASGRP